MTPGGTATGRWLLLGAAAVAALAAWLFLPRAVEAAPPLPALDVVLVDASASVARARSWLPWVRGELRAAARAARDGGRELAVLSFADGVATVYPPGPAGRFLERLEGRGGAPLEPGAALADGATRLAEGLAAAAGLLGDARRAPGRLLLLGPGSTTPTAEGDAAPARALALVRATGAALDLRAPPPREESDLGLLELVVAPRVESGAPLVALARMVLARGSRPPGAASLRVVVGGPAQERTVVVPLDLPPVDGEFEVPLDCGPAAFGRNTLRARCSLAPGPDLLPENDEAVASTNAEGARVVGVACAPELEPAARAWLTPTGVSSLAGLQFVFLRPAELAVELEDLDALVTFDLAPAELPGPLVRAFVERGGGWLALSGWGLLRDWIPGEATGLARLLPAEPADSEAGERDVILLVDGSGSMEGEPFESVRAATLELVSAALPGDRVSLRFFTVQLEREHVLKRRVATRAEDADEARRAARDLLALRVPAGRTFLLRSLGQLAGLVGERESLVLLLTDGWERDALPDEVGLARQRAAELAAADARLVVIAVGAPNMPLLAALAGGEELVRSGRGLDELRAVFHRELHGARIAEGELALTHAPRAPGSLADAVSSAGAEPPPLPPLERFVRNRLRPGAEALWTSADGEPVLAVARAGLGRTALFASRPTAGWGSRWFRPGLGQPTEFEGLLRWLARGPSRAPLPRARLEDGVLRVTGLAPDTPPELVARVVDEADPDRTRTLRLLPAAGPGEDVRRARAAPCPAAAELERPLLLLPAEAGGAALAVARVRAPELAWRELRLPAAWFREEGTAVARRAPRSRTGAPWVLGAALALLLGGGLVSARRGGR